MNTSDKNQAIYIDSFDYPLPDERIARFPLSQRDQSKLLIYKEGVISENCFANIADFLPGNSLLVYNNTRVIQARMIFRKETGARIEVFCLEPRRPADYAQSLGANDTCTWKCMVGNLKKWKDEALVRTIVIKNESLELKTELIRGDGNTHDVCFTWNNSNVHFADILEEAGELPIPPYLNRDTEESDHVNYQTVYSKIKGSVAAPTAGLHFTQAVFESIRSKQIEIEELTLHVGAGTFQPVKTEKVEDHQMHAEVIAVRRDTIIHLMQKLGNVVAVGTTSVRTLESLYYIGCQLLQGAEQTYFKVDQWEPYVNPPSADVYQALQAIVDFLDRHQLHILHAETRIMIKPGFRFRIVDAIITNFHQPKSTLLLLVSAFVDGRWNEIYDYALAHDFRFLSYGDSSLLIRSK